MLFATYISYPGDDLFSCEDNSGTSFERCVARNSAFSNYCNWNSATKTCSHTEPHFPSGKFATIVVVVLLIAFPIICFFSYLLHFICLRTPSMIVENTKKQPKLLQSTSSNYKFSNCDNMPIEEEVNFILSKNASLQRGQVLNNVQLSRNSGQAIKYEALLRLGESPHLSHESVFIYLTREFVAENLTSSLSKFVFRLNFIDIDNIPPPRTYYTRWILSWIFVLACWLFMGWSTIIWLWSSPIKWITNWLVVIISILIVLTILQALWILVFNVIALDYFMKKDYNTIYANLGRISQSVESILANNTKLQLYQHFSPVSRASRINAFADITGILIFHAIEDPVYSNSGIELQHHVDNDSLGYIAVQINEHPEENRSKSDADDLFPSSDIPSLLINTNNEETYL